MEKKTYKPYVKQLNKIHRDFHSDFHSLWEKQMHHAKHHVETLSFREGNDKGSINLCEEVVPQGAPAANAAKCAHPLAP